MNGLMVDKLHISLKKENKTLVKEVSFDLEAGSSLVLIGESGCGKTMTCSAVMDLLDPKKFLVEGSIFFQETDLRQLNGKEKRRFYGKKISYVPQNPMTAMDPSMKIGKQMDETLRIHAELEKAERKECILKALEKAGLKDVSRVFNSYPYALSGGMLQRVLIAMAIMTDTSLVVADEPTTALDVVHRNEIVDEFIRLKDAGCAVLFVTHDFASALRMGGKTLIMKDGQVVEEGDVQAVYDHPREEYTKALIEASQLSKGIQHASGRKHQ